MARTRCWIFLGLLLAASEAQAQSPALIPVQGRLADASSMPVDGQHDLSLKVFDAAASGTELFAETHASVNVVDGAFSLYLGSVNPGGNPLDLSLFRDNGNLWLEITIDASETIAPRFQFGTVPYSAYAAYCGDASTLEGQSAANLATSVATQLESDNKVHDRYTDAEALSAMGTLDPSNSYNHNRYTDVEVQIALGTLDARNPYNHNRYTDVEALSALGSQAPTNPYNHARYTDVEARGAMGAVDPTNPYHHARYTDSEAAAAAALACYDTEVELTGVLDDNYLSSVSADVFQGVLTSGVAGTADALDMADDNIINVNNLTFADSGPGEGVGWPTTTASWSIDVADAAHTADGDDLWLHGTSGNVRIARPLHVDEIGCPSGTHRAGVWCISSRQTAANWPTAVQGCAAQNMRLCPLDAIMACDLGQPAGADCTSDTADTIYIWTDQRVLTGFAEGAYALSGSSIAFFGDTNAVEGRGTNNAYVYFCCLPR